MDSQFHVPSSQLEKIPIVSNEHCIKVPESGPSDNARSQNASGRDRRNFLRDYKIMLLMTILLVILMANIGEITIYLTNKLALQNVRTVTITKPDNVADNQDRLTYEALLEALRTGEYSEISEIDRTRGKREIRYPTLCEQNPDFCKGVLNSANLSDVNDVNHVRDVVQSLQNKDDNEQQKLLEIVECLSCMNIVSNAAKKSAMRINDQKIPQDKNSDLVEQANNKTDLTTDDSDSDLDQVLTEGNKKTVQTSIDNKIEPEVMQEEIKSPSVEIEIKTNDTVMDSANQVDQNDEMIPNNSTGKSAMNNDEVQRARFNKVGRIVTKDQYQTKLTPESNQMLIPTAETIKSTQQLQLTPTMSWMQYPVCFYGPPPGGSMKQSAPGSVSYSGSSAGGRYPFAMMQQTGQSLFNTGSQPVPAPVPNFVQVQAQSVQFLPGQSIPGQKIGPTGPAASSVFPGSSVGGNRAPYYCTYIPAPTFQYPAIPGVSEYQRSSAVDVAKDDDADAKPVWDVQRPLVTGYSDMCKSNEVRCNDGSRCIPKLQWCDGHVDCKDTSDETRCSCRDRISKERLCDGYFDCPHGEDELGCFDCPRTSFSCGDWSKRYTAANCVPLSQKCDGVKQCANGKDEADCVILTPTYVEGTNVFTIGYTEGFLHKNVAGQWYPVCTATYTWAVDACRSEIGSDMDGVPDIKIHNVPENTYKGPYLAEVKGEAKIIPSCLNRIVYVRCPPISCGSRIFSHEDYLRSSADIDETTAFKRNSNIEPAENNGTVNKSYSELTSLIGSRFDSEMLSENNSTEGPMLRVVGGRASLPKAWPFLVAIYKDGNFHCGGVIVNELWVLTAAHCLDGYIEHYYEVQAGVLRRFSFSPMAQSRKARHTIIHPKYSSMDMQNDIGIIMLDEPFYFNRWVRPICLPKPDSPSTTREPLPGSICIAIGWGATRERGPDPDHLREVEVPILPRCIHEVDDNEGNICAGYPQGGRDACQGDSGGPLMCRSAFSESQWYVAGVVSHGEGCARPNEPGAYTRVSHFVQWIQQVTSGQTVPAIGKTPLSRCPGFNCEGGLGKCLPIEKRCDQIVNCLDAEDEINCPAQTDYTHYRSSNNDTEVIDSTSRESSEKLEKIVDHDSMNVSAMPNETNENIEKMDSTTPNTSTSDASEEKEVVTITTFTCRELLQSIQIEKRCNKEFDCEDGTDEVNCTCKDFLSNLRPTAICDGILDCDDLTDEENCDICKADEFFCHRSGACIALNKKCDGFDDCPLREDETDCFALTDGRTMYLDVEDRPALMTEGILTQNTRAEWEPTCHRPIVYKNQSSTYLIGQNMCKYFGFANFESSNQTIVKKMSLRTVSRVEGNQRWPVPPEMGIEVNQEEKTCPGLHIRCRPVLNGSLDSFLRIDRRSGSRDYVWPWLAALFVDGNYRCTAISLDANWLLTANDCLRGVSLEINYTAAIFGYAPSYLYVNGPHQQISRIDGIKHIKNSVSSLLHLETPINMTRYVQPLLFEKKIYPHSSEEICVALGTNNRSETTSIFLRPVLENCQNCNRCFVTDSFDEQCSENEKSEWSGIVFCQSQKGWYPAAVFHGTEGLCSFGQRSNFTSIDHINPHLMQAIEDEAEASAAPVCDGIRCNTGNCIPQYRVCDGIPDCRDGRDEESTYCEQLSEDCSNKVAGCICKRSEIRCVNGECIKKSAFCDGKLDCADGSDEPRICSCAAYLNLSAPERMCDGIRHCLDKSDESPEICPCRDNRYKCSSSTGKEKCIPQQFVCDGQADCDNGEDEKQCSMIKQIDPERPGFGEIIQQSYGIWHSKCFSSSIEAEEDMLELCKSSGFSTGRIGNETIDFEEPLVPSGNDFFIFRLNQRLWLSMQNNGSVITLDKPEGDCYRPLVQCLS